MYKLAKSVVVEMLESLAGFAYPIVCVACSEKPVYRSELICESCLANFDRYLSPEDSRLKIDWQLKRHEHAELIEDAVGLFFFSSQGLFEKVLHSLKYEGVFWLGKTLGKELGKFLEKDKILLDIDGVVPIPIHKLKRIERGFNQSDLIAEEVSKHNHINFAKEWLERVVYSEPQAKVHNKKGGRQKNVRGVFRASPLVEDKSVLLIDDVFTTGATLLSAAGELKKQGAKRVHVAALSVREEY